MFRARNNAAEVLTYLAAREIAPGGSHMLMMDRHSDAVLEAALG